MKTLAKFERNCCIIKYLLNSSEEMLNGGKLYKVVVTPKHKNTWSGFEKQFNYSTEAETYLIEQIKFWL